MSEHEKSEPDIADLEDSGKFRGWRLLGILLLIVGFIALISAVVDWLFIGGVISVD